MKAIQAFSNLTEFMSEPLQFMQNIAGEKVHTVRMGPKRFVFVFDPERAQEILIKRSDVYVQNRTVFDRIQPVTGKKGLVQLAGKESQEGRLKSRSMFNSAGLADARTIIESYCDDFLNKVEGHSSIDVTEEMMSLILQTALTIFLGIRSPELAEQIGKKFLRLNHLCGLRMRALVPVPLAIPTFKNREIKNLQKEIRDLITKHLNKNAGVPKAFDADENMIDHCMTFLFAGHETTAASLAFTFLLLARHPQYQEFIANGDEEMTLAIYKESLRLFPPAYMLAREATRDDDLLGIPVMKSDQVIIGITELHRHSDYFERPDDFYPERFHNKLKHPLAFIPFGAGGKSCVGERLAYFEAAIVLKKVCERFRIVESSATIQSEPLITLHPLAQQDLQLLRRNGDFHASP